MRNNNCLWCGKDTGKGHKGNPKIKYRGGYIHDKCNEQRLIKKPSSEKIKKHNSEYYQQNKAKLLQKSLQYYYDNRQKVLERQSRQYHERRILQLELSSPVEIKSTSISTPTIDLYNNNSFY